MCQIVSISIFGREYRNCTTGVCTQSARAIIGMSDSSLYYLTVPVFTGYETDYVSRVYDALLKHGFVGQTHVLLWNYCKDSGIVFHAELVSVKYKNTLCQTGSLFRQLFGEIYPTLISTEEN